MRGAEGLKRAPDHVCVQNFSDYSIPLIIGLGGCREQMSVQKELAGFFAILSRVQNSQMPNHHPLPLFLKDLMLESNPIHILKVQKSGIMKWKTIFYLIFQKICTLFAAWEMQANRENPGLKQKLKLEYQVNSNTSQGIFFKGIFLKIFIKLIFVTKGKQKFCYLLTYLPTQFLNYEYRY